MCIRDRLKDLRVERDLKLEALAEQTGLSKSAPVSYTHLGLSKKVTNILETIKLLAFSDPFPIEQDCIHLQNGVYHLPDGSFQESRLFCQNRLPVRYDPKAASPDRWLTFLHALLDDADIPTLQAYLGYCLIPSTKGQKMMLIVGKGGEGKSRIGLVLKRLMGDAARCV